MTARNLLREITRAAADASRPGAVTAAMLSARARKHCLVTPLWTMGIMVEALTQ